MKKDLTEIVCVLDCSGSMSGLAEEVISGFNAFVEKQKALPGEAQLTLVLFDTEYQVIHDGINIQSVPALTKEVYFAGGMTALLDAVGRTIHNLGFRLATTPEDQRPEKVLFLITTDGFENASQEYTPAMLQEMIALQKTTYSWEFLFMAAGEDSLTSGTRNFGKHNFAAWQTKSYDNSADGTTLAFKSMSNATSRYRSTGKATLEDENESPKS
jgi:hypothetical protein